MYISPQLRVHFSDGEGRMKRRLYSFFERRIIEVAIEPRRLAYQKWLDFNTREIDWGMWEEHFNDASARRKTRGSKELPEEESEILVTLLEAVAIHVASSDSYIGGVELQILTHSMISHRFTSSVVEGNWGDRFRSSIEEIIDNVKTPDDRRLRMILLEVQRRVLDMHSPIINGEFLCYPIGMVLGINQPVDY